MGGFWGLLGLFWVALGPLWASLGGFEAILGGFGAIVVPFWVALGGFGAILGLFWVALGPFGTTSPPQPLSPHSGRTSCRIPAPWTSTGWCWASPPPTSFSTWAPRRSAGGEKPHRFGILSFLTLFSLVFPCFFALFPRFLTLQLLWDLGSLHADPPAHPDAAQVSAAAPKWGFFGAKPGDFCTASLLSSSERQIYPPRGDLSHVWGFGGISDPSEAESKGIWSWRCSAFLNYGFCDPSGAELAGFGAVLSQDLSFLGSGDPIGGGRGRRTPNPSFFTPNPLSFQLLPPVPPGRGDERGLRELLHLRLAARHPPRPRHPLGAALLR